MNHTIFNKVNELLEQYIGGQIFFTELDKAVKFDQEVLKELTETAYAIVDDNVQSIASGEIGLAMHNFGVSIDLLVPGGLRHNPSLINLKPFADQIRGRRFLFIDDSYFSGKTAAVVKEEINRLGGIFVGSLVAYDGAKVKEENVWSLYRYYDHHDILGRKLEGK